MKKEQRICQVNSFLEVCCIKDKSCDVNTKKLWETYRAYCSSILGQEYDKLKAFSSIMTELGFKSIKSTGSFKNCRFSKRGIRVKNEKELLEQGIYLYVGSSESMICRRVNQDLQEGGDDVAVFQKSFSDYEKDAKELIENEERKEEKEKGMAKSHRLNRESSISPVECLNHVDESAPEIIFRVRDPEIAKELIKLFKKEEQEIKATLGIGGDSKSSKDFKKNNSYPVPKESEKLEPVKKELSSWENTKQAIDSFFELSPVYQKFRYSQSLLYEEFRRFCKHKNKYCFSQDLFIDCLKLKGWTEIDLGFIEPPAAKKKEKKSNIPLIKEEDKRFLQVKDFIEVCCVKGKDKKVKASWLHSAFQAYMWYHKESAMGVTKFFPILKEMGFDTFDSSLLYLENISLKANDEMKEIQLMNDPTAEKMLVYTKKETKQIEDFKTREKHKRNVRLFLESQCEEGDFVSRTYHIWEGYAKLGLASANDLGPCGFESILESLGYIVTNEERQWVVKGLRLKEKKHQAKPFNANIDKFVKDCRSMQENIKNTIPNVFERNQEEKRVIQDKEEIRHKIMKFFIEMNTLFFDVMKVLDKK